MEILHWPEEIKRRAADPLAPEADDEAREAA